MRRVLICCHRFRACARWCLRRLKQRLRVTAGGLGSAFQPDYAGDGIAQTSPNRLYGVGAYVDVRFSRWVQIEGEGRWLRFNEYHLPGQSTRDTYLIGPRIPIITFHRVTPYGKFWSASATAASSTEAPFVLAYGGGVDYRLSRKFTFARSTSSTSNGT